jgi:hypothetical protein
MANPKVRPHLSFFPEDSGEKVSEAKQAHRWLREQAHKQLTPMARIDSQDYYIFEPAVLRNETFCIPFRWFHRADATSKNSLYARCWNITVAQHSDTGELGWRVWLDNEIEVHESHFAKNFPTFGLDHHLYRVPHPSKILGECAVNLKKCHDVCLISSIDMRSSTRPEESLKWGHTDPNVGNRWRQAAGGRRVMALPLWLYCNDTSGNLSKKWNGHNSFLFTLAGLPREHAQKEYNVHFLSTSNSAPPLEMLDGVVDQIE